MLQIAFGLMLYHFLTYLMLPFLTSTFVVLPFVMGLFDGNEYAANFMEVSSVVWHILSLGFCRRK